jgi:hypothetical protein
LRTSSGHACRRASRTDIRSGQPDIADAASGLSVAGLPSRIAQGQPGAPGHTFNVYPAQGMDEHALAVDVSRRVLYGGG